MESGVLLALCAIGSMAVSLFITIFYKKIRARLWRNKYKLPDEIPLFPELENIPDKNNFIKSSHLLENSTTLKESLKEESTVDMLMTDESVLQNGFSLNGENLILKCESSQRTTWHEISSFPVIIGKSSDCDLCLDDEDMAGYMHGILFVKNGRHFYLDMNSINGSIVDGVLASGIMELKNGSQIHICQTTIFFITQSNMSN